MNYIELINQFWTANEEHSFRTVDMALYFYILKVNNDCSWKESFKRNNRKIEVDLNISFNTLKESRNRLKNANLIDFKTTNGDGNVSYTLSKIDKVTNEVSSEVANEVLTRSVPSKDKLNKTKLKQDNTPLPPKGEKESDNNSWKKSFEIYLTDLRTAYKAILNDFEWLAKQEEFNPNIDILKSIEKSCVNYWATEAGWKKKKGSRITSIDWKSTFANAISLNKVYKQNGKSNKHNYLQQRENNDLFAKGLDAMLAKIANGEEVGRINIL